jgi:hypothetical protein
MPDSGYKYINAAEERHAGWVRSGRAPDGPAGVILELIGDFVKRIFSGITYQSQKRKRDT